MAILDNPNLDNNNNTGLNPPTMAGSAEPYADYEPFSRNKNSDIHVYDMLYTNFTTDTYDSDNFSYNGSTNGTWANTTRQIVNSNEVVITLYTLIFVLAVLGNSLVIVTVLRNKKMRNVTNIFLLNLSISDLMLAIFCMPFNLIPIVLKNFIFGEVMCIGTRYIQGITYGVSSFTLVSMSMERYFAIVQPLRSRGWQTTSHARKVCLIVWVLAAIIMIPIPIHMRHGALTNGGYKCQEDWPQDLLYLKKAYTVFLDIVLLLVPLIIMVFAYSLISRRLWMGIKFEAKTSSELRKLNGKREQELRDSSEALVSQSSSPLSKYSSKDGDQSNGSKLQNGCSSSKKNVSNKDSNRTSSNAIRQTNYERSLASKKRVIKMLCIVVLEYFLFLTPSHVVNAWIMFDYHGARAVLSPGVVALLNLLSYCTSFCNPITYCFMHKRFRQGFLDAFRCLGNKNSSRRRCCITLVKAVGTPTCPNRGCSGKVHTYKGGRWYSCLSQMFASNEVQGIRRLDMDILPE
ncbi:unnamed protein product [Owenia fusiformis]|uniref:Gastrin/cholecystokinin type B receptor n=1 Tax=Owenia fusiformis TaxID=6347 RepID=A0A8S4NAI7_OWEFU|nr:unnamed protein product [Owenia fusiformis]